VKRPRVAIGAALVLATVAVYAPVRHHAFVNFDDPEYVTDNAVVRGGLTPGGVAWAFTQAYSANWHPLTWVSHMADVSLGGMDPAVHHATSIALHALTVLALFLVLAAMTGEPWPSGWVAALFALHPLHVESVAWVAERKDVLSALWWMATLGAWTAWIRRGGVWRYGLALGGFALALLAKPMAVSLPFVLLLLDVWPYGRVAAGASPGRLLVEKLPFFALAAAASAVTFVVQREAGAVATLEGLPLAFRAANAAVAYARYLGLTLWPAGLAAFYPLRPLGPWEVGAAAALLAALTAAALRSAPARPYLAVGWLWWVGTLVPVIGLVKAGDQAMADRFTYVPHVGLFIALAWGARDLARGLRVPRRALAAAASAAIAGCALGTSLQLPHWRDSEALWRRALAVTEHNPVAHLNLGAALHAAGRLDEARGEWDAALRVKPDSPKALVNLGQLLAARGDRDGAAARYAAALRIEPANPLAHYNWGVLLADQGQLEDAVAHYRAALAADPLHARAATNLGAALGGLGRLDGAVAAFGTALALRPDLAAAHNGLALVLERQGRTDEAIAHYAEAVRLAPDDVRARFNLGATLAGAGRHEQAVVAFRGLTTAAPDLPEGQYGLAAALAGAGRAAEARDAATRALALARAAGREPLAREIETQLAAVLGPGSAP
jgi:protein O-mannosyl-transferase